MEKTPDYAYTRSVCVWIVVPKVVLRFKKFDRGTKMTANLEDLIEAGFEVRKGRWISKMTSKKSKDLIEIEEWDVEFRKLRLRSRKNTLLVRGISYQLM